MPPPSNSKLRQNWKYVHKFRHRRLACHLVICYRRRVPQRPQWLYGTEFPSPHYDMRRNRISKKPKANTFHHRRRLIKPESEFQLSGDSHFRFHEPIPPHILDNFCGSRDFTGITNLIWKFQDKTGTELKSKIKEFLAKTQHDTHSDNMKTCVSCANVLCGRLGYSTSQYPRTTVFIWDTGASFGLTPFKINFIDYV